MVLHRNTSLSLSPSHFSALRKNSNDFFPRIWINLHQTSVNTNDGGALSLSAFGVTRQAFHHAALAYAIVNLKSIVPGRMSAAPLADINLHSPERSSRCLPTLFRRLQNRRTGVPDAPRPAPHRHARRRACGAHVRRPARHVVERTRPTTVACQVQCCHPGPSPSPFLFFSCSLFPFLHFFFAIT